MKTKFTLCAAFVAAVCAPVYPADSAVSEDKDSRVEVVYTNPEKFTDLKDSNIPSERDRENYMQMIETYLQERAGKVIAPGQTLTITIKDIDMAGDFEPWRGAQFNDVRVVKEIYPPRVTLSYRLVDESGAVVKEGERKLSDMNFQMSATPAFSQDSLKYEKALLDNWIRDDFDKPKSKK